MTERAYIVIRTLENKIAVAENNNQNILFVTRDVLKEILALLKEQQQQIWELQDQAAYLTYKQKKKFLVDSDGKITPLPDVARCKECKHRGDKHKCIVAFVAEKQEMPYFFYDNRGEWFCADGKRREDNADN